MDRARTFELPQWQDEIVPRLQSAYEGIMLLAQNTPLPVWVVLGLLLLLWIRYRPSDEDQSDLYLPMTTADAKIQFTHPFRPSSLSSRPSPLSLHPGKLAAVCDLISPRTIIGGSSNNRGSRSPSPTGSGSSSASSSASSSPLGSPRYQCRDQRCCGPYSGGRSGSGSGRGQKGSSSPRYPPGGPGGRGDRNQTRRGTGRRESWRCGLHAVQESEEECVGGV